MSIQATITAFDGAATPVSHSLVPREVFKDPKLNEIMAMWAEANASLPDIAQVRVIQRKRKLPSGTLRTVMRVEVPVMEAVNAQNAQGYTAAPKVAFVDAFEVVGYHHERSTITSRRLARQLAINIAGGIATTVTPVTTGPAAELFDQLISVS